MSDFVLRDLSDGVLTLTLNRPERRNALTAEFLAQLKDATEDAARDPQARVVVLAAKGADFCVGADVGVIRERPVDPSVSYTVEDATADLRTLMEGPRLLHEMAKPTIAVVRGACAGGGLGYAAACDLRVVSQTARFVPGFLRVGLSGDFGATYFLPRLIGPARAREALLLNQTIAAEEAKALGLATRLVADADLETEALAMARTLAEQAPLAVQFLKKNLNASEESDLETVFDLEALHVTMCVRTEDAREAGRAFFEKRKPVFKGR